MLVAASEEEGKVSYGWTASNTSIQCSYFQNFGHFLRNTDISNMNLPSGLTISANCT